jgi:hypothetical protein
MYRNLAVLDVFSPENAFSFFGIWAEEKAEKEQLINEKSS